MYVFSHAREDAQMEDTTLEMDGGFLIQRMSTFSKKKQQPRLGFEMYRIIWLIFWECDEAETLRSLTAASVRPPLSLSRPYRQEMKRSGLLKPVELISGCWCGGGKGGGAPICLQPEVPRWGDIVLEPLRRPHLRPLRAGKSWLVLLAPVAKEFVLRLSDFALTKDGQGSGAPLELRFLGSSVVGKRKVDRTSEQAGQGAKLWVCTPRLKLYL